MTPPFTHRTRPTAVLFEHTSPGGDVVSLRVPSIDDPISCVDAMLADAGVHDEHVQDAFADQMPTWWVERATCSSDERCGCGITDLEHAVVDLDPHAQQAAVTAHLAQIAALQGHLRALTDLADGSFGDVCVACVTAPHEHLSDLDTTIEHFARDLVDTLAATGLHVRVGA